MFSHFSLKNQKHNIDQIILMLFQQFKSGEYSTPFISFRWHFSAKEKKRSKIHTDKKVQTSERSQKSSQRYALISQKIRKNQANRKNKNDVEKMKSGQTEIKVKKGILFCINKGNEWE